MTKVLIVEDEPMARTALAKTLAAEFPDIEICGQTSSIRETVEWLGSNTADVIFMDVELSDGNCFGIFRQVEVDAPVIMTTAYDHYAVKAFEEGSVDYLLKPVSKEALHRAMSRVRTRASRPDWDELLGRMLQNRAEPVRERFIVKFNDKIVPVKVSDISFFHSEDKNNFLTTCSGCSYVVDETMDEIADELGEGRFFRISRNCIIAENAIGSITKLMGGRLRISSIPESPIEMIVSRSRCDAFLEWLEK